MDSEKTSPSCYPHNQKGSLLAKATGAVGGYSKAAKAAAASLRRAAGGAASAAAAASRHGERAGADPRMLFNEIELTPMGGAAAASRISSGGAPADADQHVAASMLLCEPAGGALLTRTARGGLPPLPIERVVERPPRTVRDLLPRGAPLERDGTWLMPDNWPHFLDGARGAALMTCDPDDLKSVGADAPIFVRTCIKCSKSVDTRCEPCSRDAYRKQVDVFCNACLHSEYGPILESCAACNALSVPPSPAKKCAHGVRIKDSICLLCERAEGATPEARRKQKRNFTCVKCKLRDVDAEGEVCEVCVLSNYSLLAAEQNGSALHGTVHLELMDYLLTIVLMKNGNLTKGDIEDIALGYLEQALPRPIPEKRVKDHVNSVFSKLLKCATQRSSGRAIVAGEAFDPAVHKWDVDATHGDWALKYKAAYGCFPPDHIMPLSMLRERRAREAEREKEEEKRNVKRLAAIKATNARHYIGARAPCVHGCGALLWPGEGTICCRAGDHVLGPIYNPPIDAAYLDILRAEGFSANSRDLNGNLTFAAPTTSPSREDGGVGYVAHHGGILHLYGKSYTRVFNANAGPSGFDAFRVPEHAIYDGAERDIGRDFANQLIGVRRYLQRQHPLARRLVPIVDAPGEHIDFTEYIKIDARSAPTGKLEIASLSSGVEPSPDTTFVMYFDMRRHVDGDYAKPTTVQSNHALWELLQWPLLFEQGIGGFFNDHGGGDHVVSTEGIKLTLRDYSRAMLFQNPRMGYAGRLMQEWLLSQYSRQVENQLHYLQLPAFQQKLHRKANEALVRREDHRAADGVKRGERIRMPASVVGSKAYNQGQTDDTLAVSNAYGKGTCFMTMTCNPMWAEIQEALLPGQSWTDRPDIVCRVFKLKQQEMIRDLHKGALFQKKNGDPWKCKYIIAVVEFQKRGLPHAHILFRLEGDEADMPKRGDDVDRIISACMPTVPEGHEPGCTCDAHRLRDLVQQHMMHKCSANACMPKEGPRVCRRRFPKPTDVEATTTDDNGYPVYKRTQKDDSNVVPYNRSALLKYECHINVELVSTAWVIKYIHKYLHKGPDHLRVNTAQVRKALSGHMNVDNEVEMFQVFRWTSAGEAFYRTVNFNMHYTDVGCTRLSCHLDGKDWVGKESEGEASKLLAYFKRPQPLEDTKFTEYYASFNVTKATEADQAAHVVGGGDLLYEAEEGGAASFYVDKSFPPNKVAERKGLHVARMYPVAVTQGELYYLRLLLTHLPARSYKGLRTHGETTYNTFREAAEAHGLLSTEREFIEALGRDVMQCESTTPADLRHTFVMMVLQGGEGVPVADLYERFKYYMATDLTIAGHVCGPGNFTEKLYCRLDHSAWHAYDPDFEDEVHDLNNHPLHEYHLLRKIQELIESNSTRTLDDFGLPTLRAFAERRVEGNRAPAIQEYLEKALLLDVDAEVPVGDDVKHVKYLREHYALHYPQLLTGATLKKLLRDVPRAEAVADHFFVDVDVESELDNFNKMYATLNAEQKAFADDAIEGLNFQVLRMEALKEHRPVPQPPTARSSYFHLQARGGRGKSYVTKCIISKALSMGLAVVVSAFTGVAAILLPRGQTCHRTYGLMLDVSEPLPSPLSTGSAQGKMLGIASLHVVDEVECLHRYLFEAAADVAKRCVDAMWNTTTRQPFGGAMVIVSGDWHQTLPITAGASNDEVTIHSLVRSSPIFRRFKTTILTIAERNRGDERLDAFQNALSINRAPGPDGLREEDTPPTARKVYVPNDASVFSTDNEDTALEWLFGDGMNPRHAMLCTTNAMVDHINEKVLERYVVGAPMVAHAAHARAEGSEAAAGAGDAMSKVYATPEYMASAKMQGVPPAVLKLKKGCVMLLTRNMLNTLGLVNGTRLILLSDPPKQGDSLRVLHVETVPPDGSGHAPKRFHLPRISFSMVTPGGLQFIRRQFPVRLAYAITSQKAQGQTLTRTCGDTRNDNFSHGTGYVTNSRTRTFEALGFLHAPAKDGERPTFTNVVLQRVIHTGVLAAHVVQRAAQEVEVVEVSDSGEDAPMAKTMYEKDVHRQPAFRKGAFSKEARRKELFQLACAGQEEE